MGSELQSMGDGDFNWIYAVHQALAPWGSRCGAFDKRCVVAGVVPPQRQH